MLDPELKEILDEAHAQGASEEQLAGIVDAYNTKKKSTLPPLDSAEALSGLSGGTTPSPAIVPAESTASTSTGRDDDVYDDSTLFKTNKSQFADSILGQHKDLDWVQRLYESNAPSIQVPGEPYRSTHLMADDGNGYVYPTIIRQPDGSLKKLSEDEAYDYAKKTHTGIQLPKDEGTWFAANGYKTAPGVFNNISAKGVPFNDPGYSLQDSDTDQSSLDPEAATLLKQGIPNVLALPKNTASYFDAQQNDPAYIAQKQKHDNLNNVIDSLSTDPSVDPSDIQNLKNVAAKTAPPKPTAPVTFSNGVPPSTSPVDFIAAGAKLTWNGLYDYVLNPINQGVNELVYKPLAGANDAIDRTIDKTYQAVTGEETPSWLRKGDYLDKLTSSIQTQFDTIHKDDKVAGGIATGISQSLPLMASMATGEGEISLATKGYQAISGLTKTLAVTGALNSFKDATDDGLDVTESIDKSGEGFLKGGLNGATMEAQMMLGGAFGKGVANRLAEYGLLKGEFTPKLLNALGVGTVFGGTDVLQDAADGKPVDWQKAATSFGTGIGFEMPGVIEGAGQDYNRYLQDKGLNDRTMSAAYAAMSVKSLNDAAVLHNLAGFSTDQIQRINQSDHTSDDLYALSLKKGMDAYDAETLEEKNALYMQQLSLKNQADIKLATEHVVKNKDGFIEGIAASNIPDEMKSNLIDKVSFLDKNYNPSELQKTDIGNKILDLNKQVLESQDAIDKTNDPGEKNAHYINLNNLIGQRVQSQIQLFDLNAAEQKAEADKRTNIANLETQLDAAHNTVQENPDAPEDQRFVGRSDDQNNPAIFTGPTEDNVRQQIDSHFNERLNNIKNNQPDVPVTPAAPAGPVDAVPDGSTEHKSPEDEQGIISETHEASAAQAADTVPENAGENTSVDTGIQTRPEGDGVDGKTYGSDNEANGGVVPEAQPKQFTPTSISNPEIGDAEIVAHKDNGAVTIRYDGGTEEDVQPEHFKDLGIQTKDVNEFKKVNGIGDEQPLSLNERINELGERIAKGDVDFSAEDTRLHQLYPDRVDEAVHRAKGTEPEPVEQASMNGKSEPITPEEVEIVKQAMTAIFPNIKAHYYDAADDFNKAAMQTPFAKVIENGGVLHAFVDANKEIHFNPDFMGRDTQLHEQGHILTSWAKQYAPDLYKKMLSVGSQLTGIHSELAEKGYDLNGASLHEEAFVTALGREGAKRLEETIKQPIKRNAVQKFMHDAWTKLERWVADKTGFSLSKFKNIDDMSIPKFIDYVNEKYQLSDVKISDVKGEDLKGDEAERAQADGRPVRQPGQSLREHRENLSKWLEANRDPVENVPPEAGKPAIPVQQAEAKWDLEDETRGEKFTRKWQDYLNRASKLQDAIDQGGGTVNEGNDFYHAADLQGAKAAQHQKELYERMVKSPDKDHPAFFERLLKDGMTKEDLDNYLRASHVEEYNREVGKRRREAYDAELNRMENNRQAAIKNKNPNSEIYYEREIKKLQDQKNAKYPLMDDGAAGMTNVQAKQILDDFKAEDKFDGLKKYGDEFVKEVSNKQLDVQLATGVIDRDTYDNLKEKYKNYVPFQVESFLEDKEGRNSGTKTNKVDNLLRRAKGSVDRTADERVSPSTFGIIQLEKAYIEGERNQTLNKLYNLVEQNPNDSVYEIVHPRYSPIYRKDGTVAGFKEITDPAVVRRSAMLYRDGRKVYIDIKDKTLLRAINRDGIQPTIKALDSLNSYFRAVSTVYSPEFWVTNSLKHVQLGAFNLTTDGQKDIAGKMVKNSLPAMKATFDYERGKRDGEWAPYIERYLQAGGKLSGIAPATDIEKIKSIGKMVDDIGKKKNLVQNTREFIHWVSLFGEASGVGPRLAIFRAGVENGMTDQQAATTSREVTINFNKKGEWSGLAGNFYLMFNAGAQGKLYTIKKLINSPLARKIYGGMFVAGMMTSAMNRAFSDPDDDPVTEYDKQNNFVMKIPGTSGNIKFPLGFGLNFPFYLGTKMDELMNGKATPGAAALDAFDGAMGTFSPLPHNDLKQTLTPTEPLRTLMQYGENKNSFGTPIFKDPDKFGVSQPSSHVHFKSTDPIFVNMAQGLNHITGGTGVKSGLLDFSPDVMQWMYGTATGGLGTTVQDAVHTGVGAEQHAAQQLGFIPPSVALQPIEVNKVPFLRKFYTEGLPINYQSVIFSTLDKSGNHVIDNPETTDFMNALMGAAVKGEINPKQYKQYMDEFMKNQVRLSIGDTDPDLEKKDIDLMFGKKKK